MRTKELFPAPGVAQQDQARGLTGCIQRRQRPGLFLRPERIEGAAAVGLVLTLFVGEAGRGVEVNVDLVKGQVVVV